MSWLMIPAQWMRSHLAEIAFSITAMMLVVGGPYLNVALKKFTRNFHWVFRYALFVLLTTVGYGLITNFGLRQVRGFMGILNNWQLLAFVLGVHLVLAWFLKRDKAI